MRADSHSFFVLEPLGICFIRFHTFKCTLSVCIIWSSLTFSKYLLELWIFKQSLKISTKYALYQGEIYHRVLLQHWHVLQWASAFFLLILFAFAFSAQSQAEVQTISSPDTIMYLLCTSIRNIDTKRKIGLLQAVCKCICLCHLTSHFTKYKDDIRNYCNLRSKRNNMS